MLHPPPPAAVALLCVCLRLRLALGAWRVELACVLRRRRDPNGVTGAMLRSRLSACFCATPAFMPHWCAFAPSAATPVALRPPRHGRERLADQPQSRGKEGGGGTLPPTEAAQWWAELISLRLSVCPARVLQHPPAARQAQLHRGYREAAVPRRAGHVQPGLRRCPHASSAALALPPALPRMQIFRQHTGWQWPRATGGKRRTFVQKRRNRHHACRS